MLQRRQHQRYKAIEDVFAVLGSDADIMGRIQEMGEGGLSFTYRDNKRKEVYTPIVYHKGNPSHGKYRPKKYVSIHQHDLEWINYQLDNKMERLIGYEIATCTKEVNTR